MKKRVYQTLAITPILALALSACTGSAESTEETIELSFANIVAEDNTLGVAGQALFESVEEEYDGEVSVDYYWSGALADADDMLNAVGSGLADVGGVTVAYFTDEIPTATWSEGLLGLNESPYVGSEMYVDNLAFNEIFQADPILAEYAEQGAVPIVVGTTSAYDLVCNEPIESLDDAAGKVARVASSLHREEVSALGMTPISLSHTETYEALQHGTVDCVVTTLSGGEDLGLFEQAKYVMPVGFSAAINAVLINEATLNSLPDDFRDLLFTTGRSAYFSAFADHGLEETIELVTEGSLGPESDVEIIIPTDLVDALSVHQSEQGQMMSENAPGSLSNPESLIQTYESTSERAYEQYTNAVEAPEAPPSDSEEYRDMISQLDEAAEEREQYLEGLQADLEGF